MTLQSNTETVEKEEYIFSTGFTESRRRWDCGMSQKMEWTFEGGPERFQVWTDGNRSRYLRGVYVGIRKEGYTVNLSGTADVNSSQA